ncbi:hypothetical protein IV203_020727 [Nitzschia inconspicua]|uniref:Uncharacterized protein n=1 Tax=Nitzschia inconspicua TaxID=303405 RepID=A0A9K3KH09_9STRA|nr:hypothetical protein IV203_021583 [Nitzschia inconspicua]KAG7342783.1 hypothetical protein IV203_020727 [Nitzschia inconspicua]
MSPADTLATTTPTPPAPAGKFYDDDDNDGEREEEEEEDGSVSSGSSSDSSDSDDDDDDEEEEPTQGIPKYARPPVTTKRQQKVKDEEEEDDEEVIKIRQKAFDLINKAGGPSKEDRNSKHWPQSPEKLHYPVPQHIQQQQQSAGEQSAAHSYQSPYQQSAAGQRQRQFPNGQSGAHEAERLSIAGLFINCVSDLCKQSSKEILQHGASILSSGYQSVSQYKDPPLHGSYDPIDTSQHGYGNGNNDTMMRGRYRD